MQKKTSLVIIALCAVLVLGGAVAWLFASGKLRWEGAPSDAVTSNVVCDDEIIGTFNEAREVIFRGDSDIQSADEAGQKKLGEKILTLEGYEDDATCQTILLWTAYLNDDYDALKQAYDRIALLHEKRVFADTNLQGIEPLKVYASLVASKSPDYQNKGFNGDE